jgi:hypothetical protein
MKFSVSGDSLRVVLIKTFKIILDQNVNECPKYFLTWVQITST